MQQLLAPIDENTIFHIGQLFQSDTLPKLIRNWTKQLQSPSHTVTASQFAKRYSFLLLVPRLQEFYTKNQIALIHPKSILHMRVENGYFQLHIEQECVSYLEEMTEISKQEKRDLLLSHLFANHFTPLWNTFAEVTGIQQELLWENVFIYVSWVYQKLADHAQANADFQYISQLADGKIFGLAQNPFTPFLQSSLLRKKCCLYFMLPEATVCCRNCPLSCSEMNPLK